MSVRCLNFNIFYLETLFCAVCTIWGSSDTGKVLFVPFLLLLLKIAFDLAIIVLAVFAVSRLCGKPVSLLIVIAAWLSIKVLLIFLRRKSRS